MEISMTQGEANRKALDLAYTSATGKAWMRIDAFNRIVEVADDCTGREGDWVLIATKANGLRVAA